MMLSSVPKMRRDRFKVARPKSAPSLTLNRYDLERKNLYDRYSEWVFFHGCVDVRSLFYSTLSTTMIIYLEELEKSLMTNLVRDAPMLALSDFSTFSRVHTADESLMYEIIIFEQIGRQLNKGLLGVFKISSNLASDLFVQDASLISDISVPEIDSLNDFPYFPFVNEFDVDLSGNLDLVPRVYLIRGLPIRFIQGNYHDIEYKKLGLVLPYRGVSVDRLHLVDFENLFFFYMERMLLFCSENGFVLKPKIRCLDHYYFISCQPRFFNRSLHSIELLSFVDLVFHERFERFDFRLPKVVLSFPWYCSAKISEMLEKISDLGDFVGLDVSMKGATTASVGIATFGINGLDVLTHVVFPGTKEDDSPYYCQSSMRAVDAILTSKIQQQSVFFCLGSALEVKILVPRVRGLFLIDLHNLFGSVSIEKFCSYLGFKKTNLHDSGHDAKLCLAIFFYMAFLFDCRKFSRFKKLFVKAFSSVFVSKLKAR